MDNYILLRNKFPTFVYHGFCVNKLEDYYEITYDFETVGLCKFSPKLRINKRYLKKLDSMSNYIIFNIGMIELLSYWKATCSKDVIIEAGYIDDNQILWFKKLFYYGLGELFYKNNIFNSIDDFMNLKCVYKKENYYCKSTNKRGYLIPIGGGKDSCVTLELLKKSYKDNCCFMINPKNIMIECTKVAGYTEDKLFLINRILDKQIIDLNSQGFINGHTPFSSIVAFLSYLIAYENDIEYIVLSNESSANEETIIGTKINHQYSKSYEFEKDFNEYIHNYFDKNITYFSILRPLSEIQISKLFSNYKKYHKIFKSCNLGSKEESWKWCCNCPKCLFTFIILSPFLSDDEMIGIFGDNLLDRKDLLDHFLSLIGESSAKPFECVGSIEEVNYALNTKIENLKIINGKMPFLLDYYLKNYYKNNIDYNLLNKFNYVHNLNYKHINLLKEEWKKYV